MPDEVTAERVAILARAGRVPLAEEAASRVARATSPTAARFAAANVELSFETEPSSFTALQRREISR
jgi:hypothetical protein